ncbi:class III signal peptide-containing protein [Candidatus Micrarchaeota archaeon]|nr:class III signal peptide-containing protein [Candidatus Micrarchaeota archaeon]
MKGQTAVEYLLLIGSVVGVVALITFFIKRYVMG